MIWLFILSIFLTSQNDAVCVMRQKEELEFRVSEDSWSTLQTPGCQQLENAVSLVYGTLFQNLNFIDQHGWDKFKKEIIDQSLLLRRLYLFLGLGELWYQPEGGDKTPWPFPLATCLTQGQRVSIILEGISSKEFLNFMTGNNLRLLYKRKYSSHGAEQEKETRTIKEIKIKSILRRIKATEIVLGMDFPFGGIGNPLPDGSLVGPRGWECSDGRLKKKRQIGHLHLYAQDFPEEDKSIILIGIEGCAPGTSNQLGCNHNMFSGLKNQKVHRSVSGGSKWSQLDTEHLPPSEYMGKTVYVSSNKFEDIKQKINFFLSFNEEIQKSIFKTILPKEAFYVTGFLWTYQSWTTE